mgnify:CR=1 FL=1
MLFLKKYVDVVFYSPSLEARLILQSRIKIKMPSKGHNANLLPTEDRELLLLGSFKS